MERKKIYAENDPNWGMYNSTFKWVMFPRLWNPVLLLLMITTPILSGIHAFGKGFVESVYEIKSFIDHYKVW